METFLRKRILTLENRYNSLNDTTERYNKIAVGGKLRGFKEILNYVVTHNKNNVTEIGIDPILSAKGKPIDIDKKIVEKAKELGYTINNENPYEVYKDIYLQLGEVAKLTGFVIIVAKQNETLR